MEYDKFETLLYEGEYKNGRRNGKGKEYFRYDGKLIYKGEFQKGKRYGKGKEYRYDRDRKISYIFYEGEYKNDIKDGKGKEYDKNGNLLYECD